MIVMTETNREYNAIRQAAAIVATQDDRAEAERAKAKSR